MVGMPRGICPVGEERPDGRRKPERIRSGKGGPGAPRGGRPGRDRARRGGRHRGFRGRHRPSRGAAEPRSGSPADLPAAGRESGKPQRSARAGPAGPDEAPRPEDPRDMPACPLCGKPVYDLSTALAASREAGEPAHFDCVLERVAASESIAAGREARLSRLGCLRRRRVQGQERERIPGQATHPMGERRREEGLAQGHLLEDIQSLVATLSARCPRRP